MAIYHFSMQVISRGKGQSAIASASYRSGEKLIDEQTGEAKFYKRDVQPEAMILAPSHAPDWVHDRQRLWNEVEAVEKNWNSQLAREFNVALPKELTNQQQLELIRDFVQDQFVDKGMVADVAIHRDDSNNPHAHVMLTMRPFNKDGSWGNKKKRDYVYDEKGDHVRDNKGNKKFITVSMTDWDRPETLEKWREEWANYTNQSLERVGVQEKISHLSHEERGLKEYPTIHLGHIAHAMEKKGIETERGNMNREIKEVNRQLALINKEIKELTQRSIEIEKQLEKHYQTEKKSVSLFEYTPDETKALTKAKEHFKGTFTYENMFKRLEQLERFEKSITEKEKAIYGKKGINLTDEDRSEIGKLQNQRKRISTEKDILNKATMAFESALKRGLASQYPNNPEIKYLDIKQAIKLQSINRNRDEPIPIEKISKDYKLAQRTLEKYEDAVKKNLPIALNDNQLKAYKGTEDLLGGILQGLQQAQQAMARDSKSQKQHEKPRYRGQKKKDLELEM